MSAARRLALLLGLCVSCSKSDASAPADHSPSIPENAPAPAESDDAPDLSDHSFPLLVWAAHTVQQEYFDKSRIDPRAQLLYATTTLGLHTPEFFATVDPRHDVLRVKVRSATEDFPLAALDTLGDAAERLEAILEFTQTILDLEPEPLHELEYAAINGLFAPLDPHTILLTPEEHADLGVRTKGEFGGIGAQIRAEGRRIVILRVLPGMPAQRAGLEAGDVILQIDGARTVNMTASEAQQILRGPVGTTVEVKLRRGKKTLRIEIERAVIKIDSVLAQMLPDGVAYLQITNFQENTAEQVEHNLAQMGATHTAIAGVVLDLRGNSGGLLTQATAVVDQLVQRGELVIVRSALGREVDPAREEVVLPEEASVVVLVDEQSASASEIVSGGVKALGRGVVLGRSSFGKGTVQMIRPAAPYGRELALKLTVAEYLVAGDRKIQSLGVVPDLQLHPVERSSIPGIVRYFDLERFERERERSRTANLPSSKHDTVGSKAEHAHAQLHYLWTDAIPESAKPAPDDGAPALPEQMRDPEVRIAQQVALALRGTRTREARLDAMKRAAQRIAIEEDTRIAEALEAAKVDWSAGPGSGIEPEIEIRARLVSPGPIPAGRPFDLRVELTNEGLVAANRVHLITDCVHDELDGIELMIGSLGVGETVVRDLDLHVMPWHTDFTDRIALDVHIGQPEDVSDARTSVMFEVEGAARPSLSYDYWIVDDPALVAEAPKRPKGEPIPGDPPFSVEGNGDGVLQPGEKVLLAFVARNDGPGASPDVRAVLRNLSGKQGLLEEGLVGLGQLAPGDERSGAFGITISEDADPSLPFELELIVGDAVMRTSAQDKLRYRIRSQGARFVADPTALRVQGEPVRIYAGAHGAAHVVAEVLGGTRLQALGKLGDWHVVDALQPGRRFFVPADLAALQTVTKPLDGEPQAIERQPAVLPPEIAVDRHPRVTSAAELELRGAATHPERVRDVVVLVRPPGPSQIERKVHYAATAAGDPDGRSLAFSAEIPLEPGGNRITILARDGAKVQKRRDLWVYREP